MLAHVVDIAGRGGIDIVLRGVAAVIAQEGSERISKWGSDSLVTLVSVKRNVLLVRCPRDILCLQKIHDSGDADNELGCKIYYDAVVTYFAGML